MAKKKPSCVRSPVITRAEREAFVGRSGVWTLPPKMGDNVKVPIKVTDARQIFGRLELQVMPDGGSGNTWAARASIELDKPTGAK